MSEPIPPSPVEYFYAALKDPEAAIAMLGHFGTVERDFLTIVACQEAIFSCFPSVPTTRQIRELTSLMRRLYGEEVNSFAVATLINSCFNPKSPAIAARVASIEYAERNRVMLFIPHAVYFHTRPAADLVDLWVRRAVARMEQGQERTLADFGEDVGGFYRVILIDVEFALKMLTEVGPARWAAMVLNAATGALHFMFESAEPRQEIRQRLLDYLAEEHGFTDADTPLLDELMAYALTDRELDPETNTQRLCAVGVLLPRAMMKLMRPSPLTVVEYLKTCKATDDAIAAHHTTT